MSFREREKKKESEPLHRVNSGVFCCFERTQRNIKNISKIFIKNQKKAKSIKIHSIKRGRLRQDEKGKDASAATAIRLHAHCSINMAKWQIVYYYYASDTILPSQSVLALAASKHRPNESVVLLCREARGRWTRPKTPTNQQHLTQHKPTRGQIRNSCLCDAKMREYENGQ